MDFGVIGGEISIDFVGVGVKILFGIFSINVVFNGMVMNFYVGLVEVEFFFYGNVDLF